MKKDITIKSLLEHGDVFADIANVNLFGGRKVLQSEDLEAVPAETGYKDLDGEHHILTRDCFWKIHKNGRCIGYIGYEAQADRNNVMPVRDMGYAYTAYMKQIRGIIGENNQKGASAYTKVLHDEQKLLPVVTCILYFGIEPWKTPLSLLDILDISEGEQTFWREMAGDYRIHVISLLKQPKEVREQYQSDFRIIADYMACYDDEKKLVEEWMENRQVLIHPEQLLDLLTALSSDRRMKDMRKALFVLKDKEEINMCLLMDIIERDYMQKGLQEGREKGRKEGREEGREEGRKEGRKEGKEEGIRVSIRLLKQLGLEDDIILNKVSQEFMISTEEIKFFL